LIGDKAYDSDKLDQQLKDEYGIEMIAPNRCNRGKTQDRRKLRRYKKRWKVERLFAWMHNFRRLVTRRESHIETSSHSSNSLASKCCLDVYETTSR
jgi:transposase